MIGIADVMQSPVSFGTPAASLLRDCLFFQRCHVSLIDHFLAPETASSVSEEAANVEGNLVRMAAALIAKQIPVL